MKRTHIIAFTVAIILAILTWQFGKNPWLALVAIAGPLLAWGLSILGVSGAVIFTWLSGGKSVPIVAMVGFLIFFALSFYSYFSE